MVLFNPGPFGRTLCSHVCSHVWDSPCCGEEPIERVQNSHDVPLQTRRSGSLQHLTVFRGSLQKQTALT